MKKLHGSCLGQSSIVVIDSRAAGHPGATMEGGFCPGATLATTASPNGSIQGLTGTPADKR